MIDAAVATMRLALFVSYFLFLMGVPTPGLTQGATRVPRQRQRVTTEKINTKSKDFCGKVRDHGCRGRKAKAVDDSSSTDKTAKGKGSICNVQIRQLLDLSARYHPVVRNFVSKIRIQLSQQGRGFALACAGMQQIVSNNRIRHVSASLRQTEADLEGEEISPYSVTNNEMIEALGKCSAFTSPSKEDILKKDGWKSVHATEHFSLYKRRIKKNGPIEYLMFGKQLCQHMKLMSMSKKFNRKLFLRRNE